MTRYDHATAKRLIAEYVATGKAAQAITVYMDSGLTHEEYLNARALGRSWGTTTLPAPVERNTTAILQEDPEPEDQNR